MRNYFIKLTVNDPYPKHFESSEKGSNAGIAIKRAIQRFRKERWQGRHLNEIIAYAKKL